LRDNVNAEAGRAVVSALRRVSSSSASAKEEGFRTRAVIL
jgi:hypothetical protein